MLKCRVGLIALAVAWLSLMSMAGKIHGQKSAVRSYLLPASVRSSGIAVLPKNETNAALATAVPAKNKEWTSRRSLSKTTPLPHFSRRAIWSWPLQAAASMEAHVQPPGRGDRQRWHLRGRSGSSLDTCFSTHRTARLASRT